MTMSFFVGVALFLFSVINMNSGICSGGDQCLGTYCSGERHTGATCVNGTCQCLNNPMRDRCTCLSIIGSCHIRNEAGNAVATATFRGSPPRFGYTTYSCVANDNCDYEVHVLGNYESNGHTGFRVHNDGFTNLYLTVTGSSSRPLILVLSSYEHVQWTLHIPTGVVIDKVIISSYLNSSIVAPSGQVLAVENNLRISGYGSDDGGGRTHELLNTIYSRFGPVSSFTGTYQADVWRLNINRTNPDHNCLSAPFELPTTEVPVSTTRFQFPTMPPLGSRLPPLSLAETQCIQNEAATLTDNSAFCSSIDAICSSVYCYDMIDKVFTRCGRPDVLPAACASIGVSPRIKNSSSSSTSLNGVWYGLGFGLTAIVVVILLLMFMVRRRMLSKQVSPARSAATANSSQRFDYIVPASRGLSITNYNAAGLPGSPPKDRPEGVMGLPTAEPPSYAEVQANKDKYNTCTGALPPPYPLAK